MDTLGSGKPFNSDTVSMIEGISTPAGVKYLSATVDPDIVDQDLRVLVRQNTLLINTFLSLCFMSCIESKWPQKY